MMVSYLVEHTDLSKNLADGAQTPTRTSCNRRGHQSSNVKGAKDRLKEVRARLRECNKKKNQKA